MDEEARRPRGGLVRRVAGALRWRDRVAEEEPPRPPEPDASADDSDESASDARSEPETAARIDAARERLREEIPPREDEDLP